MIAIDVDAACAIWRRIDNPGHDAARLTRNEAGWRCVARPYSGTNSGPACINYLVDLDPDWSTRSGRVQGFLADRPIDVSIGRKAGAWTLNGTRISGLEHVAHLDYGFTPATNLQQLRATSLRQGQWMELPVAWFDVDTGTLSELPQRYERIGETTYRYAAPTVPYEAILELSSNGFVANYPGLWIMEP